MLQTIGPQPLIEPEKLKSEAEWIEAGQALLPEMIELRRAIHADPEQGLMNRGGYCRCDSDKPRGR